MKFELSIDGSVPALIFYNVTGAMRKAELQTSDDSACKSSSLITGITLIIA
jgi:hypothetical protein